MGAEWQDFVCPDTKKARHTQIPSLRFDFDHSNICPNGTCGVGNESSRGGKPGQTSPIVPKSKNIRSAALNTILAARTSPQLTNPNLVTHSRNSASTPNANHGKTSACVIFHRHHVPSIGLRTATAKHDSIIAIFCRASSKCALVRQGGCFFGFRFW